MLEENLTTPAQLLQRVITTSAGAVLAVILIWQVSTLADVKERLHVMESRTYPPRYVTDKLSFLNEEQRRCQMQIDRLEGLHPGVTSKGLPPYSLKSGETFDLGYDGGCFLGAECRTDSDCGECYCDGGYCTNGDA